MAESSLLAGDIISITNSSLRRPIPIGYFTNCRFSKKRGTLL
ncbi:hypothetical protein LINPERPRIM_LOCUS30033 [Linum perenne]